MDIIFLLKICIDVILFFCNRFIIWRKSNKVLLRLQFTPNADLKAGEDVYVGFNLLYTYVNTVTNTPEKKEPTTHDLNCRVYVKVGSIEG